MDRDVRGGRLMAELHRLSRDEDRFIDTLSPEDAALVEADAARVEQLTSLEEPEHDDEEG